MQLFAEIQGQDAAKAILQRAIETQHTHHGYIFRGPEGIGKKLSSLAFATLLNCSRREEGEFKEACGQCPSCHKMKTLQHPDFMLLEPTGASRTIKIDAIRRISKFVRTRPFESRYQIIIIDDAHTMTIEASNALLKTLEEPPSWVRMFLITHQPNNLLETIRSRGQFLPFQKLGKDILMRILREYTFEEGVEINEDLLKIAIQLSEGSASRAIAFIEGGVLERRSQTFDILNTLDATHPKTITRAAAAFLKSKNRDHAKEYIDHIQLLMRELAGIHVGISTSSDARIQKLASRSNFQTISMLKTTIDKAKKMVHRNGNTTLVFEWLLSEIADNFRNPIPL